MHAYLAQCAKKLQYWFDYKADGNSETLECSAINDGRSMLVMFRTVLYLVVGLGTETLTLDLMQ